MQMYGNLRDFPSILVHEVWVSFIHHDPCTTPPKDFLVKALILLDAHLNEHQL